MLAYRINTSSTNSTYCSLYYVQTADIDLSLHYWDAIGTSSYYFSGHYDGGEYTISGLYTKAGSSSSYSYQGLFGYVRGQSNTNKATIKNVGITDSNIQGYNNIGGVVGSAENYSDITNCYNTGSVSGSDEYVGGVVGYAYEITITNCYNTGSVTENDSYVGGVVGYASRSDITNCYNTGNVTGSYRVGGVVGDANSSVTITNCYNTGTVTGSSWYIGGVVGYANSSVTITNCYNTGTVTGSSRYNGGVVGQASASSTIISCYNTGSVHGSSWYTGGVVGSAENYSDITNCYNTGSVTGNSEVGGVVGYTSSPTVTNCYNTGSVTGSENVGGVVGLIYYNYTITNCYYGGNCTLTVGHGTKDENLIANAKSLSWYQDSSKWSSGYPWDFENIWTFVEGMNDGYPVLRGFSTKITYNSNTQPEEVVSESFSVGTTIVLAEADLFVREGYSVSSWNTVADGSGVSYAPGATYTGSSVTLYAQWGRMTYTVTFDANGGSGTMSSVEKNYNEDLVLPANEFTKTGYDFKGWATSANGSVVYGDGAKYTTNASATLYAVWEAMVISVNLDVNGGAGGTSAIYLKYDSGWYSSSSCTSSSKITALPSTPTRTGYEFKGYSTEPGGSGTLAVSETGAINVSDTFYSTDGTRTWYAVWEARNPAYYDSEGGFWYVENGKLPQSKVSESLKSTLSGQWSSLTDGSIYYMGVEELVADDLTTDGGMQSKVYNGEEYVKFNGEYYLVEPIRWRLVYSSSQKEGYAVENTSVLATMAEIVFVGSYSSAKIGVGAGYSAESVTMLLKNQVSDEYLVSESREVEIFGTPKDTSTASGSVFVASKEELANFTTSKNNTTGSGVKAGKVSFSDFVKDYLRATGQGDYYFTRDLGDQLNTIRCLNPVGNRSQAKAQQTLGVQFTIKVTEYACKSV